MEKFRFNAVVENALIEWASSVLEFPVIWEKQDAHGSTSAKKPTLPYASLDIMSGPSEHHAPDRNRKEQDIWTLSTVKKFTLEVTIYDDEKHLYWANLLADSLRKSTVLAELCNAGIGFWTKTDVQDRSVLLDTMHELRAGFDAVFSYVDNQDDETGEVTRVKMDPTYNGEPGDEIDINV